MTFSFIREIHDFFLFLFSFFLVSFASSFHFVDFEVANIPQQDVYFATIKSLDIVSLQV